MFLVLDQIYKMFDALLVEAINDTRPPDMINAMAAAIDIVLDVREEQLDYIERQQFLNSSLAP